MSQASDIVPLPTVTCLTEVRLDQNFTSAHEGAAILRRVLSQRVSVAQHAYTACVPEVTATVTGFMMHSGQGERTVPRDHGGSMAPGAADSNSDVGNDLQQRPHVDIMGLRDSWVHEPLPTGLRQLREAVMAQPQLVRSWTKFATYRGLGTWMEVRNAEAAEFQSTCATVLEDLQSLPEPRWTVSQR